MDETLTWDDQVTLITKKVNKGLKSRGDYGISLT